MIKGLLFGYPSVFGSMSFMNYFESVPFLISHWFLDSNVLLMANFIVSEIRFDLWMIFIQYKIINVKLVNNFFPSYIQ